jgi:DNA (cytosine-5)-methyltransferase 1
MIHFSLFSGIGGFDLASEWIGWRNMLSCEINSFCNKILKYYWPNAYHHEDIHTLSYEVINENLSTRYGNNWRSDDVILTGGFPCQPYSAAGKRLGKEDDRHLWPQMLRIIREVQPTWVVGENVFGLINWNEGLVFDEVQSDLEAEGYEVQPYVLPAVAVNAPHRRDRVWFVAHSKSNGSHRTSNEASGKIGRQDRDEVEQPTICGEIWDATNSDKCSKRISRKSSSFKKDKSKDDDEQSKWREQAKQYNGCSSILQYASDTKSKRSRQFASENQGWQDRRFDNYGTIQYASDTRLFRPAEQKQQTERTFKYGKWDSFPTQSPICSGDDGLPTELDGITFSKWRNESIKGYGNAIVPQVALQIFKAIKLWEDQANTTTK